MKKSSIRIFSCFTSLGLPSPLSNRGLTHSALPSGQFHISFFFIQISKSSSFLHKTQESIIKRGKIHFFHVIAFIFLLIVKIPNWKYEKIIKKKIFFYIGFFGRVFLWIFLNKDCWWLVIVYTLSSTPKIWIFSWFCLFNIMILENFHDKTLYIVYCTFRVCHIA